MDHFNYFAAAYFVFIVIFFIYVATLQKKIKIAQDQINQFKNKKVRIDTDTSEEIPGG